MLIIVRIFSTFSISTGRTRGTEDVDILVPVMSKNQFTKLFAELRENGFWCYQSENTDEVYDYSKGHK